MSYNCMLLRAERTYLVVVFHVSDNSAEVLDSKTNVVVHLLVYSVVCRIWVSEKKKK